MLPEPMMATLVSHGSCRDLQSKEQLAEAEAKR